jgi:carbon storage regulator
MIGDNITITVVEILPHAVKIGINAPAETTIMRKELVAKMKFDHRAQRPKIGKDSKANKA